MKLNTRFFFLTLFTQFLIAQITGIVTDKKSGEPILGVNVVAGEKGTFTNERGEFQLDVPRGIKLEFSHIGYQTQTIKAHTNMSVAMIEAVIMSKEIIVRAGLSDESLQKVASSVTIITGDHIRETGADHFQSLTEQIPNLNWAGGTSRPRYFQIRGIGERSHYFGEGPPNFSVGFVLDDMDLSGLGMVGLLYDIDQIEIFKGPQSSVYGPNAMAGLISLKSTDPTDHFEMRTSTSFGSDNHYGGSSVMNVQFMKNMKLRLGGVNNYSDGFRENVTQSVTHTNKREESFSRMKLSYDPNNQLSILATLIYTKLENGYDAWAPDNNTDFKTYSNDKGEDSQRTYGYSLRANFEASENLSITSITSFTETDLVHAYDGDWADSTYWHDNHDFDPAVEGWAYEFYDKNERNRANLSQEIRLSMGSIILGGYFKHLIEQDEAKGYLFGGVATDAISHYDFQATAGYAQYGLDLTSSLKLKANVRFENNSIIYDGSSQGFNDYWEKIFLPPIHFNIDHSMLGYRAALHYLKDEYTSFYGSVSQGYKSGGVNQQPYLSDISRPYEPEFIRNFEIGLKHATDKYRTQLSVFYGQRKDQQVSVSSQQVEGDPNSFLYYTGNAGSGTIQGFEWENMLNVSSNLSMDASLGYLKTWVDKFIYFASEGMETSGGDREAAMSPVITGSLRLNYSNDSGIFGSVRTSYKSGYFYSDSHNEKAEPYTLTNLALGKSFGKTTAKIWIRNAFDERFTTRGFYFGLIPPNYPDQLWKSYGDPRQIGVSMDYKF
ncbi:MAG: TonB-dependent receptor [Candidatus Neomarinimicrobiota bacterium]|nr:TonB-dependent receptor [Candidatus Neomarinimicrobiota bacterium]